MARYSVTISGNKVGDIRELNDEDYDELGIEWALSELRDSYRHTKMVNATFSLKDRKELKEFLGAVKAILGAEAIGENGQSVLKE